MKRCVQLYLCLLLLSATNPIIAQAQEYYLGKFPYFSVDYASFRADSSKTYVEIYTQIAFSDLQFVNRNSHYSAIYEVDISFYKGNQLTKSRQYTDSVHVQEFERTKAQNEFRLSLLGVLLDPGEYQCKIFVKDSETKKEGYRIVSLSIKAFDEHELDISDLQLAQKVEAVNETSTAFVKCGRFIEPNVTNIFSFFALKMHVYYEVYGLAHTQDAEKNLALVHYKIIDRTGTLRKSFQKEVEIVDENNAHNILLAINDLPPGRYTLEVEVKDPVRNKSVRHTKKFLIGWAATKESQSKIERLVEQIAIIATTEEANQLRLIYPEKKRAIILAFWRSKDPSPETLENEIMQEFYRRINYSNRHFGNREMEGWRTDRGWTYVRYGPPNSIQRLLSEFNREASEIWYYDSPQNRFHFVENSRMEIFEFVDKGLTMRGNMK